MPTSTGGAEPAVRRLTVHCHLWTINQERTVHWAQRADWVNQARWAAKVGAKATRWPAMPEGVVIEATPLQARGKLADAGNHLPPAKACIDGFRDAGLLVEDDPRYVDELRMRSPLRVPARDVGVAFTFLAPSASALWGSRSWSQQELEHPCSIRLPERRAPHGRRR
jgi:hypothetical protein